MNCAIIIKDAKFFGHITQTILSGQYVVYNGKYYEVHEISPDYGIVLRRASDLYSSRRYYRQLRTYHMGKVEQSEMVSSRNVAGMKLMTGCCDFSVDTDGYLDMQDLHDCRTARHVDLREDPKAGSYRRSYHNKRILTVKLPDMDEDMRYTLGLLFSELFRSLYPAGWAYLAVLAKKPEDLEETYSLLTYDLEEENSTENLYIVEDSELDLGLLDSVIRNMPRLAAIETMVHELTHIWQYLNWKDREKAWNLKMEKKAYTAAARDILYEGMTIWVSIQYLYQVGESSYAAGLEQIQMARDDARGAGFRLYAAQYPLVKDMTALRKTPFTEYIPVDLEKVKSEAHRLLG